jgi:hypothetical protein
LEEKPRRADGTQLWLSFHAVLLGLSADSPHYLGLGGVGLAPLGHTALPPRGLLVKAEAEVLASD